MLASCFFQRTFCLAADGAAVWAAQVVMSTTKRRKRFMKWFSWKGLLCGRQKCPFFTPLPGLCPVDSRGGCPHIYLFISSFNFGFAQLLDCRLGAYGRIVDLFE